MKKTILIILTACLFTTFLSAQGQYEKGMQKALQAMGEGQLPQAIALFERISKVEKEKWVPDYYLAQNLIWSSFGTEDKTEKMALLEKAKASIATAHEKSPDNSEIVTLEGYLYTAYLAMDPATYGMEYEPKVIGLHQKAIKLNPDNPRAHANLIEYNMGKARWFNQDLTPFCKEFQALIPKFENQTLETPFAPSHGLERAKEIAKTCDE